MEVLAIFTLLCMAFICSHMFLYDWGKSNGYSDGYNAAYVKLAVKHNREVEKLFRELQNEKDKELVRDSTS